MKQLLVVDSIEITEKKSMLIIQAQPGSIGQAMHKIWLAMRDASENNLVGTSQGTAITVDHESILTYYWRNLVIT